MHAVTFFDLRDQFRFDELYKLVGAAAGRKLKRAPAAGHSRLYVGRTQITRAVCIYYSDHDHLGHAAISRQKLDRAAGVTDVSIAIGHVKHWIAQIVSLVSRWYSHQDCSLFSKHSGVDFQSSDARRHLLR